MNLSICVTAHNEGETIRELILRLDKTFDDVSHEFVLLNNGSNDDTLVEMCTLLHEDNIEGTIDYEPITLPYLDAYKLIVERAKGDMIAVIDADLQYPPEELRFFYDLMYYDNLLFKDGTLMMTGVKIHRADSMLRKIESLGFHFVMGLAFGYLYKDPDCGFRVFPKTFKKYVAESKYLTRSPGSEMIFRAHKDGKLILEWGVSHYPRRYGKSTVTGLGGFFSILKEQTIGLIRLWKELN